MRCDQSPLRRESNGESVKVRKFCQGGNLIVLPRSIRGIRTLMGDSWFYRSTFVRIWEVAPVDTFYGVVQQEKGYVASTSHSSCFPPPHPHVPFHTDSLSLSLSLSHTQRENDFQSPRSAPHGSIVVIIVCQSFVSMETSMNSH